MHFYHTVLPRTYTRCIYHSLRLCTKPCTSPMYLFNVPLPCTPSIYYYHAPVASISIMHLYHVPQPCTSTMHLYPVFRFSYYAGHKRRLPLGTTSVYNLCYHRHSEYVSNSKQIGKKRGKKGKSQADRKEEYQDLGEPWYVDVDISNDIYVTGSNGQVNSFAIK